eukprot:scaffold152878_cov19-Tisochrysis_lutea.AAC.1
MCHRNACTAARLLGPAGSAQQRQHMILPAPHLPGGGGCPSARSLRLCGCAQALVAAAARASAQPPACKQQSYKHMRVQRRQTPTQVPQGRTHSHAHTHAHMRAHTHAHTTLTQTHTRKEHTHAHSPPWGPQLVRVWRGCWRWGGIMRARVAAATEA